ncbi:MAG TPA: winged helix-turn-helix domain-containing protein [Phycisphaerales bacterium]|nr:winged helix-turn-helix domain-containing protein [Phycisphaerales bacterium]HMP37052.1 winged helix-turn-helix domain-containing protein [Phycisphaerales bacterium]
MPQKTTSKKPTPKKSVPKKARRAPASAARADGDATTKRALADAQRAIKANIKAIAAADQENAAKSDERATSADGMTASERAVSTTETTAAPRRSRVIRRWSGLTLAAEVLAHSDKPLSARVIADRAIAEGWRTSGKTPHATLYAAITREIAAKGPASRFRRVDRGLFASTGHTG